MDDSEHLSERYPETDGGRSRLGGLGTGRWKPWIHEHKAPHCTRLYMVRELKRQLRGAAFSDKDGALEHKLVEDARDGLAERPGCEPLDF